MSHSGSPSVVLILCLLALLASGCFRAAPPLEEFDEQLPQSSTPVPDVSPTQVHPVVRKRLRTTTAANPTPDGATTTPAPSQTASTQAPVMNGGDFSITTNEDTVASVTLATATYSGTDGISYLIVSAPAHGSLSQISANPFSGGTASYTPSVNYAGADSFSYTVCSGTTQLCASPPIVVTMSVAGVNDSPSISAISNQTTNEDSSTGLVNFTVSDPDNSVGCSQVSATSSNGSVISNNGIVIAGGNGSSCTLTLNPLANANGSANVSLSVTDGTATATQTFALTVNAVNDAPTMSSISSQSTNVNLSSTVAFNVSDADGPLACSSTYLSYTSSSPTLVAATGSVTWSGTWPHCLGTITPVTSMHGAANLTFQISDNASPSAGTASQSFQLTINDSLVAPPPVVTVPALAVTTSATSTYTISGTCVNGYSITLGGDVSSSQVDTGSLSQTCANQSFSWVISKSAEGNFTFQVTQLNPQDSTNTPSSPEFRYWTRDVTKPAIPVLTNPVENPTQSNTGSFTFNGTCEPQSTISLTAVVSKAGISVTPASTTCSQSGTFSFSQNLGTAGDTSTDAIYSYSVLSTDPAGNSSAAAGFVWDKNASYISAPSIVSVLINNTGANALNSSYFVYTTAQNDSLTITGNCVSTANYTLSVLENGVSLANPPVCSTTTNTFTLTLQSTGPNKWIAGAETSWFYEIYQSDPNGLNSPKTTFTWLTDNMQPAAPTFNQPAVASVTVPNRLFVSGTCATSGGNRGTVRFFVNGTLESSWDAACAADNTFSTTIDKTGSPATYTITAKHSDPAGNLSPVSSTITWTQDPASVPIPVITSPTSAVINNSDTFSIYGNCEPFYVLTLSGSSNPSGNSVSSSDMTNPAGSLTQTCTSNGKFTYTLSKASDATYSLNVSQQASAGSTSSAAAVVTWTRDTTIPNTPSLNAGGGNPYSATAYFTFSGTDNTGGSGVSRYECATVQSPSASDWSICTSPFLYWTNSAESVSTPLNVSGTKYFTVRSVDAAGNAGSAASTLSWTPTVNNSVLLHQFENNQSNSSSYVSPSLNFNGSGSGFSYTTGRFGTALSLAKIAGSTYATSPMPDNNYLSTFLSTMTLEFFINVAGTKNFQIIGQPSSWSVNAVGAKGNTSTYHISFTGFLNGATTSQTLQANCAFATGSWKYVAIRFNRGAVDIYCDSNVAKATAQWGVAGKARLNDSSSDLVIGSSSAGTSWSIDSLRISQGIRTISPPTQTFSAD